MSRNYKTPKGTELPLLNLRGKDYLEVKYRLVWFREEHPNWSIETQFVSITDKSVCAKAAIRDEQGRIIATSHKNESEKNFHDFMEKAETGAIGRALALIGYGTQFCADELDEGERIVDAPVANGRAEEPDPSRIAGQQRADLAEFQISFGKKYRGKKLKEVPRQELESYLAWLEADAQKKNTPLSHEARVLRKAVDLYFSAPAEEERPYDEAS